MHVRRRMPSRPFSGCVGKAAGRLRQGSPDDGNADGQRRRLSPRHDEQ